MAEQSVQGGIHSVFQKSSPTDSLAPKLKTKKTGARRRPFSMHHSKTQSQLPESDCSEGSNSIC